MDEKSISRAYTDRILALMDEARKLYNYDGGKFFYAKDYGTVLGLNFEDMKKCTGIAAIHIKDLKTGFGGDVIMTDAQLYEVICADSNIRMMIRNKIRENQEKREAEKAAKDTSLEEYKKSMANQTTNTNPVK